ncbi:EI24 domain-containing protein [Shimia sp.]|uniref:EI24 domain-containing protein n=1 Tax=Shimia sp. TaxID=1954381 RepID=UPI003B8DFFC6
MAVGLAISSFGKTLSQIGDPRFRRVIFKGIGLSFLLLFAVNFGFFKFLVWLGQSPTLQELFGDLPWVLNVLTGAAVLFMIILSTFLMMPVAALFASIFLDNVADAVEDVHYSNLPQVPALPFSEGLKDALNHFGVIVFANTVALSIFVVLSPLALFIFWGLNGFLLGREYFQLVAMRRVGRAEAKKLRKKHMGTIWLAGILMAVPLSIPLINLVIPILGAATFTHLYHQLEPSPQAASSD